MLWFWWWEKLNEKSLKIQVQKHWFFGGEKLPRLENQGLKIEHWNSILSIWKEKSTQKWLFVLKRWLMLKECRSLLKLPQGVGRETRWLFFSLFFAKKNLKVQNFRLKNGIETSCVVCFRWIYCSYFVTSFGMGFINIDFSIFFHAINWLFFSVIDSSDLIFEAFHGYICQRESIEFYTNKCR